MKYTRFRRPPRPNEIQILNLLTSGPLALASGPVGRCSSRGWIRYVGMGVDSYPMYELTTLGRVKLEEYGIMANINPG
jgi:hypothetical protein